jgi:hypothetical protein
MADRVAAGRRRGFVGRTAEIAEFTALIRAPDPAAAVLFVHGPAGVGKSTLLRRFLAACHDDGVAAQLIDARDVPPTAEALAHLLMPVVEATGGRTVVLLDTYELLTALDNRLREDIAPQLPADSLLVIAGQHPPAAGWRTDPGWSHLLRVMTLRNLDRDDCAAYLSGRGIDAALHERAADFTHGHPLALALVGEVIKERGSFTPQHSANVIAELVGTLVQGAPTAGHRRALEAAAQVRVITEPLLAALLDVPDAAGLFDWMCALPFVDLGPQGLYLHDLARTVLAADLRWRHPERHVELHDRARRHYLARVDGADPAAAATGLMDLMYLHTDLRRFLQAPDTGTSIGRLEPATPADHTPVLAMIERHEGAESVAHARFWLAQQPRAWFVVRDHHRTPVGVLCLLTVPPPTAAAAGDQAVAGAGDPAAVAGPGDPAVVAAHRQLATHRPLRPGERVTLVRYWLSRDDYQSVSPVQSLITTGLLRHYLTTPGLAVSLVSFAHPEEWLEACAYTDHRRSPAADFEIGGRRFTSFSHDWRVVTPAAWVATLSALELGAQLAEVRSPAPLAVLGHEEFAAAAKRALRDLNRPDRLRDNPLLRSRLVSGRGGDAATTADRVTALQAVIRESVAELTATATDKRLGRVLHRAYLSPASTLERAAEVLDLPSSTFRRLLSTAVNRVIDTLWHREIDD